MKGIGETGDAYNYLCVDDFLGGFVDVQSLNAAFECGLIDHLIVHDGQTIDEVSKVLQIDRDGLSLLLGLLKSNHAIIDRGGRLSISPGFGTALEYRDLLQAKMEFANLIAPDLLERFDLYIRDPGTFMTESGLFELFDYRRCYEVTKENLSAAWQWMKYTTVLTRYETPACLQQYDFSRHRTLLDLGGNSGEFVRQICESNPDLSAVVMDLPVVCELGREHVNNTSAEERIRFLAADVISDPIPGGFDIVTFKSMLHDWPDEAVAMLLKKAAGALEPDGTILIFERARPATAGPVPAYGNIPVFLFMRFYRRPDYYQAILARLGFSGIEIKMMQFEMPFMLISAKKR